MDVRRRHGDTDGWRRRHGWMEAATRMDGGGEGWMEAATRMDGSVEAATRMDGGGDADG